MMEKLKIMHSYYTQNKETDVQEATTIVEIYMPIMA